ncbi:ENTH-domain-containing protein [Clathrospora elynae]|uniref:ENTH-domain-containing protein n=1 Tax=Clathrospora elynae TaxID=706981 RepID=A0A6A5SLQ8_9PLEO|nr:ENTH-domain-containing protein [Clathrospora elynae]
MSKIARSVKNVTKGYSQVEVKVRNATSNDPWGPVGSDMAEIAQITFNSSTDFYQVMDMLDKRLNDRGKNWRHVLKSLKVLDYCLHEGSELVVTWARKNIYIIKTLREFQHTDEDGRDVGQNVRMAAKELTSLIMDEERLRAERADRKTWKSRVTGIEEFPRDGHQVSDNGEGSHRRPRNGEQRRNRRTEEEDLELRLALEASKNEAEEEKKRRQRTSTVEADDDDLAKAIKLSKEEEELRRKELEQTNADLLFGETTAQPTTYQPTGNNQGYQQQGQVDWFGNLVDQNQQQPQNTGFLNNAYSQPTGMQPQQTGFQNGYGGYGSFQQQPQQQQPTGFDQFGGQQQPQQQQYMQPHQTLQPQQTSFNMNNPYGQYGGFGGDMGQQQQQPQQDQNALQPGSHNPWASNKPQESLMPQPTGSNNPFAQSVNRPQPTQTFAQPTMNTLHEQKTQTQFNNTPFNPTGSFPPQQPAQPAQPQKEMDPHAARLNALLATGEGQDTFGNVGNLRLPAQHTAPGTFVNSAGAGLNRINANATGNNPFLNSQFTGMPQQNRVMPAQTGPAGNFGANPYSSANPADMGQRPRATRATLGKRGRRSATPAQTEAEDQMEVLPKRSRTSEPQDEGVDGQLPMAGPLTARPRSGLLTPESSTLTESQLVPPHASAMKDIPEMSFPFMKLPAELRIHIYYMALVREEDLLLHADRAPEKPDDDGFPRIGSPAWPRRLHVWNFERTPMKDPITPEILRLNKLIYKEARQVLYSDNVFTLSLTSGIHTLSTLHQRSRSLIKHVVLTIPSHHDILDGFADLVRLGLRYCWGLKTFRIILQASLPDDGRVTGATSVYANAFHILRWLPRGCKVALEGNVSETVKKVVTEEGRLQSVLDELSKETAPDARASLG